MEGAGGEVARTRGHRRNLDAAGDVKHVMGLRSNLSPKALSSGPFGHSMKRRPHQSARLFTSQDAGG